jgi:hypothetical protein
LNNVEKTTKASETLNLMVWTDRARETWFYAGIFFSADGPKTGYCKSN